LATEVVEVNSAPSHLFKKGQSGNPAGRPKGSKNQVTLVKLAIEGELREEMKGEMSAILKKGLEKAKNGDTEMIKYFLDKWITPAKASAEDDAPRERVEILIGRLSEETPVKGRIIEHAPQE
jgi:hypothetical protein